MYENLKNTSKRLVEKYTEVRFKIKEVLCGQSEMLQLSDCTQFRLI